MRTYIIDAYSNATTTISCGQTTTSGIKLLRGVKQGDPLSPILFNLILDELLDSLPSHIGVKVGESSINSLAFADDLILTSETPTGMGHLISLTKDFFNKRNMSINVKKCFSMRMTTSESRTFNRHKRKDMCHGYLYRDQTHEVWSYERRIQAL